MHFLSDVWKVDSNDRDKEITANLKRFQIDFCTISNFALKAKITYLWQTRSIEVIDSETEEIR